MIDPRVHVHVGGVAVERVPVIRAVQHRAEGVHVTANVLLLGIALRQQNLTFFGIDVINGLSRGGEAGVAGIWAIDLHHVSAGDLGAAQMFRLQFVDIHAVFASLDFFFEYIDAVVIRRRDGATAGVHIHLDKSRAGCIAANVPAQLINEWIVNQDRFVIVRRIQDPIRIGRHSEGREVLVGVEFVPPFDRETFFGQILRAGAADIDSGPGAQIGQVRQRASTVRRFKKGNVGKLIAGGGNGARAEVMNDH